MNLFLRHGGGSGERTYVAEGVCVSDRGVCEGVPVAENNERPDTRARPARLPMASSTGAFRTLLSEILMWPLHGSNGWAHLKAGED